MNGWALRNAVTGAVLHNQWDVVRYLMDNGMDINDISLGVIPILENRLDWIRLFHKHGVGFEGNWELVSQCIYGNDMDALVFLEACGVNLDCDRILEYMGSIAWRSECRRIFMYIFDRMNPERRMSVAGLLNPAACLQMGIDCYNYVIDMRNELVAGYGLNMRLNAAT